MATAHMFVDYQNLHMSAHEQFARFHEPVYQSLVHPAKFADRVAAVWASESGETLVVDEIHVFRGLPDPRKQGTLNSKVSRHHSTWKRDGRVQIHTRPLRYPREWPDEKAQEKGIDVMLALGIVRCAIAGDCDRIIVVSRDTDLLPAVEMAEVERPGSIILATWDGSSILRPSATVPTIQLSQQEFNRSRDTTHY